MTLGDLDNAPWLHTSSPNAKTTKDWRIKTGGGTETYKELAKIRLGEGLSRSDSSSSEAHKVMIIRRDLRELADWHSPASTEAVSLARAIEVTIDTLFDSSPKGNFTWSLEARYALPNIRSEPQSVKFRLERHNRSWKVFADEIEAALSL